MESICNMEYVGGVNVLGGLCGCNQCMWTLWVESLKVDSVWSIFKAGFF